MTFWLQGSCKNVYGKKLTEEVIFDQAHKTEPHTRANKDSFEKLMTSMSVRVFFWFISFMFAGWVIWFIMMGVLIVEDSTVKDLSDPLALSL